MTAVGPNVEGDVPPERILKSHEAEVAAHQLARRRAVPVIAGRAPSTPRTAASCSTCSGSPTWPGSRASRSRRGADTQLRKRVR